MMPASRNRSTCDLVVAVLASCETTNSELPSIESGFRSLSKFSSTALSRPPDRANATTASSPNASAILANTAAHDGRMPLAVAIAVLAPAADDGSLVVAVVAVVAVTPP